MADRKLDLSAFTSNPNIKQFWADDADHDKESRDRAYAAFYLGQEIAVDMNKYGRPLRYLLQRAAQAAGEAVAEYMECDLNTQQGIEDAKALQSRAIRYREMGEWLEEAMALGDDAAPLVEEYEQEKLLTSVDDTTDATGDELNGRARI